MPPLKDVLLAPFFKDVDDYDCRLVDLDRDVNCGDILNTLATELGVPRKSLSLHGIKGRAPVRFQAREAPIPFMQVKGVDSLSDLPTPLKVKSKKRSELTLEQAMKIQEELLDAYSDRVFVLMMKKARKECKEKWDKEDGGMNTKDYTDKMKPVLEYAQEMVLPKWGYDATAQGMLQMQFHFAPWDPLPEVAANVEQINRKLGFDYSWVGREDDELMGGRNFGQGGKMKLLYLYGGGVNSSLARVQSSNVFRDLPIYHNMEVHVLEAPHESHVTWHVSPMMQQMVGTFGQTIYLYFERMPYANCQSENWPGIEESLALLKEHLRKKGPYDGVLGFDMGGEVLLQAAKMQQEGDPALKGMFRFMVLFTSGTARHCSELERPTKPLRIPAVISWSESDDAHPFTMYEETALFFAREQREVIKHSFGHMPPKFSRLTSKEQLDRLAAFLDAMYGGETYAASSHPDNDWCSNLTLPMSRGPAELLPGGTPRRLLVVHDPMGAHDYEERIKLDEQEARSGRRPAPEPANMFKLQGVPDSVADLKACLATSKMTSKSFKDVAHKDLVIDSVEFSAVQQRQKWHPAQNEVLNAPMKKEDIVMDPKLEATANSWATEIIKKANFGETDRVGIVGLGTGGFIAFTIAKALVKERKIPPMGLWLVDPPTRLPIPTTKKPGLLGTCPVTVLLHSSSTVGPPWCYETATNGPYSQLTFKLPEDAPRIVVDDYWTSCLEGDRLWQAKEKTDRTRREEEEKVRREQEKRDIQASAERLKREAEEKVKKEGQEKARKDAQERARQEAELAEQVRKELERQQAEAAEQERKELEEKEKRDAESAARAKKRAEERALKKAQEAAKDPGLAARREECEQRCKAELASAWFHWDMVSIKQVTDNHARKAPGMNYGLEFPWSGELLREMGPEWLTKAFHAAGTMHTDNAVIAIKDVKEFVGGGACSKLLFEVEYAKDEAYLHTKLFAKIPYPLAGKTQSDRLSSSVNNQPADIMEINAYRLLESRYPFRIPKYYFGDMSNETTNWILITERILFGETEGDLVLEPRYEKMRDWELKGAMDEYYYLLVRLGAELAGMYKANTFAPVDILSQFFGDPKHMGSPEYHGVRPDSSGIGESEFKVKIKMAGDFIGDTAKVLFTDECKTPQFISSYKTLLAQVNAYRAEISWWMHRDADYVSFTHANLNVDNVWFWRDQEGKLGAGVLDWGGVGCGSVGSRLWWWLYCCEFEFLSEELDGLLQCFAEEYQAHGGPQLDCKELRKQFTLAGLQNNVTLLGSVPQIYGMCPKKRWPEIKDRKDPRICDNIDGKNTLRIYIGLFSNLTRMVQKWGLKKELEKWMEEFTVATGIPKKTVPSY